MCHLVHEQQQGYQQWMTGPGLPVPYPLLAILQQLPRLLGLDQPQVPRQLEQYRHQLPLDIVRGFLLLLAFS